MRSNSAVALARVIVELGDVARLLERVDGRVEHGERVVRVGVDESQTRRVARDETDEEVDAVLVHVVEAFAPEGERRLGIDIRVGAAGGPVRVGDEVRVAQCARGGHGLVGQRERLVDAAGCLQAVEEQRQAPAARVAGEQCHALGRLDIAVEVAVVHLGERFDQARHPGLARFVPRVVLEGCRRLRGNDGLGRAAGEAAPGGAGVQPREVADVRTGRVLEELLGPADGLEQLDRCTHECRVRGDVGRGLEVVPSPAPPEGGAKIGELDLQPVDAVPPLRAVPVRPASNRLGCEACGVPVAGRVDRAGLGRARPRRTAGSSRAPR